MHGAELQTVPRVPSDDGAEYNLCANIAQSLLHTV